MLAKITVQTKMAKKVVCTVLQFVQFPERVKIMSLYQEWFTAEAAKITVRTAPETVQNANNSFVQFPAVAKPDPAPIIDATPAPRRADDLDASTADLRLFVGRVVSNDQMIVLMRRSNRGPVKVWGEWYKSATWPCDHLIRGWWEAVNA